MFITGFVAGFLIFVLNPTPARSQEILKTAAAAKVTHLGTYLYSEQKFVSQIKSQQQETIFDNSNQTNGFLPPNQVGKTPPVEFLDWGKSNGGTIDGFQIGYATSSAGPISLKMKFYYGTDDTSNGTEIASYDLTGLPGSTSGAIEIFTFDVDISGTPFDLPPGNFGYGYVINDSLTGPLTATGGTGITDFYRLPPSLTNLRIAGFFAQFYMQLTGSLLPMLFVNNALSNGDGSFLSPFNNLTDAAIAAGFGYFIYVYTGNGPYNGGFAMKSGQSLFGSGVNWQIGGQVVEPAGKRPVITDSTGNGIDLADSIYVGGLDIVDPLGCCLSATNVVGTNTFGDMSLSGGTRGIDILNSSGTFTFDGLDIDSPSGTAFNVDGGSPNINYNSGSITQNNPAQTLNISNASNGAVNIGADIFINNSGVEPAVQTVTINGYSIAYFGTIKVLSDFDRGINAEQNIFCTIDYLGDIRMQNGGDAVTILNSESSTFNFNSLSVEGSRNGIIIDNSADDINFGLVKITKVDSSGVRIRNSSGNVTFKRLDIDSARVGVQIDSLAGKFEITGDGTPGSGGTIQNTTESFICADNVVQVEIVALSLVSVEPIQINFLQAESFSDVDLDLCIPSEPAGSIDITLNTKDEAADSSNSNANSLSKNSGSQTLVILANSSLTGAGGVNIRVGGTVSANIELIGNTITTTADSGITVQTSDSSTALVTLTGNEVSSATNDFVLTQDSSSTLQLAGFAGGDAAAVAAFIQENNAGTPSVAVSGNISADPTVSVDELDPTLVPADFRLAQNYPNPFNPQTVIRFQLPVVSRVALVIYDITGRRARTLVEGDLSPGNHSVTWDGRDDMARQVASGLYLARLQAGDFVQQRKMLLMK